ncbi:hypothetical protein E2C01_058929 [Portunus trituberculatus]|uniref:Uncharacterized protein n=1 Tax=Portunus trituberculatus TaxID=210409 RepID=A0A5B7H6Z4_PORTR|nr:hypothetical protein [Portunus trituberculatus]
MIYGSAEQVTETLESLLRSRRFIINVIIIIAHGLL